MAASRSGAFALVACPCQGLLLSLFGKRGRCRTGVSIGWRCLVAFRAKNLGIVKPVARIPHLVMNIEIPGFCASCHIILLYGLRPFACHRRGGCSFWMCPPWRTGSNSRHAHKKIPPCPGFGGILSRRIFFLTNGFPLGKNGIIKKHSKGRLRSPMKKALGAMTVVPRAFTFCTKLQLLKSVNELLPLIINFDATTRYCLSQGKIGICEKKHLF